MNGKIDWTASLTLKMKTQSDIFNELVTGEVHRTIEYSKGIEMTELVLKKCVDSSKCEVAAFINQFYQGRTALHTAVTSLAGTPTERAKMTKILLENGANIETKVENDDNALHLAICNCGNLREDRNPVVKELVNHIETTFSSSDQRKFINLPNKHGFTALILERIFGHMDCDQYSFDSKFLD